MLNHRYGIQSEGNITELPLMKSNIFMNIHPHINNDLRLKQDNCV